MNILLNMVKHMGSLKVRKKNNLSDFPDTLTASEKGYPPIFDFMEYWVLYLDDIPVGYTGCLMFPNFCFVGNTYIKKEYRGKGFHSFLLKVRNKQLHGIPKIAILNPIENSKMQNLVNVVSKLGYRQVKNYEDISDIMSKYFYREIKQKNQQIWRID